MSVTILDGDARAQLAELPDESVDCVGRATLDTQQKLFVWLSELLAVAGNENAREEGAE